MIEIRSILFPTDFSDASKVAIPYVLEMARRYSAEVHLLHVLENFVTPVDFAWTTMGTAEIEAKRSQTAGEGLETLAREMSLENGSVSVAVEHGAPFHRITEYAKTHDIDLVVMATHGRTGLNHLLVGSTAERVVRLAPCPVMTVKTKVR